MRVRMLRLENHRCDEMLSNQYELPPCLVSLAMMTVFWILLFSHPTFAEEKEKSLPRFTTIKSNHVNARTGPGITYPIEWVFISRGEPVKVTAEFEQWRKVEDINGPVGWIHSSILSPKRSVVITCKDQHIFLKSPQKNSRIVARLENGLRCNLDKIKNGWCKLKCKSYKGWVEVNYVWGLTKSEIENE
jgi:SH3-like domain-containing protein